MKGLLVFDDMEKWFLRSLLLALFYGKIAIMCFMRTMQVNIA